MYLAAGEGLDPAVESDILRSAAAVCAMQSIVAATTFPR